MAGLLVSLGAIAAEDFEMLMLEVSMNREPPAPVLCLRDADGGYWVEETIVDAWRIEGERPAAMEHSGIRFLSINGFEGARASFDETTVSLAVTFPPKHIAGQVVTVRADDYPQPDSDYGAFADYDLNYLDPRGDDESVFSALLQPTLFSPAGFLRNAIVYRNGFFDDDDDSVFPEETDDRYDDGFVRLETTWVRDDPVHLRSIRLGDSILEPGNLGAAARFGGVQFATNFDTRPNLVTFPLPAVAGQALLDSSVELFVDGRKAYSGSVDPGPFAFREIPVTTGAGQVQMVTRDLAGREQIVVTDFYATPRTLRDGLSEYAFSAGALREDYGLKSNEYGDAFVSGFHRHGVTDRFTIEGQAQASSEVARIGGAASFAFPRAGVTTAGLAFSRSDGSDSGYEWLFAHNYQSRRYSANLNLRGSTDDYRQLNSLDDETRLKFQVAAGGGLNFSRRSSIATTVAHREYHDGSQYGFVSASYTYASARNFSLFGYATYLDGDDTDTIVGIRLTHFLGGSRSANYGLTMDDDGLGATVELRSDLPVGPGMGYRLAAGQEDGDQTWEADVSAQNDIGRVRLESDHDEEGLAWQASASGSMAWVGGMPFLTREIRDAFAVVKVDGFEGVRVYQDNHEIGRTDSSGRILIPGLRPYQDNQVRIEVQDLPLTARVDSLELSVTPYQRSGVIADFPARDGRDVLIRMVLPDGSAVPEGSIVTLSESGSRAPVGLDGTVYLEDVTGVQQGGVTWRDQRCVFELRVPEPGETVPDLGNVECLPRNSP
jgi:outer membrane usher protein